MEQALPQPNFPLLTQHLIAITHQINLIPNMPAILGFDAVLARLDAILALQAQQHDAILAQQQRQHEASLAQQQQQHQAALAQQEQQHNQQVALYQQLIQRMDTMEQSFRNLPRQLQNSTASLEEPLLYPSNINANLLPRTKRELLGLDLAAAQAAAHTLGLPPLVNPTAAQCRQYVYDSVVLGAR